jgi:hypothetical protein
MGDVDSATCVKAAPCRHANAALAIQRPPADSLQIVSLQGKFDEGLTVDHGQVAIIAQPGASLTRSAGGAILTVRGDGTWCGVYGLAITDGTDPRTPAIVVPPSSGSPTLWLMRTQIMHNAGGGISAAAGSLTLAQSIIGYNAGGGVLVGSGTAFDLVGNVFVGNGITGSPVGAVAVTTSRTQSGPQRIAFNTFYANVAQDHIGAAVECSGSVAVKNSIFSENGTETSPLDVGSHCTVAYSLARTPLPGTGNVAGDPGFLDTTHGNLRVGSNSPAARAADLASDISGPAARDADGTARGMPATVGAYQVK